MTKEYETHHIKWCGIEIEIRHSLNWLNMEPNHNGEVMAHIEIETIHPKRAPLPVTETGYRSHFTHADEITAAGGAIEFIRTGLDEAAQSKEWKRLDAEARQGELFQV